MKILIVEDEEALAKVLAEKFAREGFEVRIARDGEEAMPVALSFRPDIIALDILLPRKNGLEVLRDLKADSELRSIPVVMLSNLDSDEDIKNAISLGASDYFVKSQHLIKEIVEKMKLYSLKAK